MKMKKMIYFLFALLLLSATSMNAQVAIGTDPALEPHPGTILDLRHVSGNNMGLLLPKVTLTDAKLWAPVEGEKKDEVEGMMVFNDNTSTLNDLDGEGIYVWYDSRWNKISSSAVVPDSPLTQDDPNPVSICYGETTKFTLAAASGGSGTITYNWQQSLTGADGSWEDATGTRNGINYTTPVLTASAYYRRQATDASRTINSDPALVTVYPPFTQGNPANANVCQGLTTTITLAAASGGSGAITYNWQKSTNNSDWEDADGTRNTADYTTPTTLTANTYFRRKAIDAECEPIYSNSALVTVSPAFTQPNPAGTTVCYSGTTTITLGAATGGSGAITYNWQQSEDGSTNWVDATGTRTNANYTTPALNDDMYYRRQATCTCGTIESQPAKVTVSKPNGTPVTGKSGFTYDTYSYPNNLGLWTENIKEAGYAATTYGIGSSKKGEGERGYYYEWSAAAKACEDLGTGWALPTNLQWDALKAFVNGASANADEKNFMTCDKALAGYWHKSSSSWNRWGQYGVWWSAGTDGDYYLAQNGAIGNTLNGSNFYYSVRCIKSN